MKATIKWVAGAVFTTAAVALPIILSTPFEQALNNGRSYESAVIENFKTVIGSPLFHIPLLISAVAFISVIGTLRYGRYNAGRRWWKGILRLSIKRAACALVDNLPEEKYDMSARAQALAEEMLSLVNHGHMPLAYDKMDAGSPAKISHSPQEGPWGKKDRTINAIINISTLNSFARKRKLKLPWLLPPVPSEPEV